MKSYFCIQGSNIHSGGWLTALHWAKERITVNSQPIKIFCSRAGEKEARILAEVTQEGIRYIPNGRSLRLKDLLNGTHAG